MLWEYVAEKIATDGHEQSFTLTEVWLAGHGVKPAPVLMFLEAHRVRDDFSLIIEGDPHKLFGPTADRLAQMPLERQDLEALITWLDSQCRRVGCDDTHRLTREWLRRHEKPLGLTEMSLLAQGGGCDCEVVLNVVPANIYPAAV